MGRGAPSSHSRPGGSHAGAPRRSVVRVTAELRRNLDQICVTELTATIKLHPPRSFIHCQNMEHPLQQLVQRAKTLDNDYETLQRLIEPPPARRPVGSEMALAPVNSAATQPDEVDS